AVQRATQPAAQRPEQARRVLVIALAQQAAFTQHLQEHAHLELGRSAALAQLLRGDEAMRHVAEHASVRDALVRCRQIRPCGELELFHGVPTVLLVAAWNDGLATSVTVLWAIGQAAMREARVCRWLA